MDESARPTVDPALADCLARNSGRPAADIPSMTPQQARAVYAESRVPWNDGQPAMAEVLRDRLPGAAGGLRFVRLVPEQAEPGTVVYFHGGGWVTGSIETHDGIMRRLAVLSRRCVVGLDYPLAPETRRAAMLAACLAALRQVMQDGEGPVVLAGDSAGAELALACTLALRDQGARLPEGLGLAYPALWLRFETPSHLRLGDGRWPAYDSAMIAREEIFPVCSPAYLQANGPARDLAELARHKLIHLDEPFRPSPSWRDWFAAAGLDHDDRGEGLRLNDYALVLQAALEGQGVALGWQHLTAPLVERGLLLRPLPQSQVTEAGFYVIWPKDQTLSPQATTVRDWILSA